MTQTEEGIQKEQGIPSTLTLLNQKVAEGLKRNDPKTPEFYPRPKIHKEGNPGRPVVSSVNCRIENISKYIDYYLQPIVKEIPSHVKDT